MEDAPETPAHVFAYRAFKTTLFGTPAPTQVNTIPSDGCEAIGDQDAKLTEQPEQPPAKPVQSELKPVASSPIKSILLTPGTTTQQRKTVTFSSLRDAGITGDRSRAKETKHLSRKPPFDDLTKPKDSVRRSLFHSPSDTQPWPTRTETQVQEPADQPIPAPPPKIVISSLPTNDTALFTDTTVDLKSPKSLSGKHWKTEYQREHDRTKAEMKRLIRYSQVAKSFAAKRDGEASRMREKLEDADCKVKELEQKVTQLASELGGVRLEDQSHSRLVDDLAVQTANALKYKEKAERYRAALRNEENFPTVDLDAMMQARSQEDGLKAADSRLEARASPEHNDRMAALEAENETLRSTIARVKEEMQRYEERHRSWQENRRRRDERWAAKRKDLEDQLAQSREENRRLQIDLRDARVSSSSQESRSTPLSSQESVPPLAQQDLNREALGLERPALGGTLSLQPEQGETSTQNRETSEPAKSSVPRVRSLRSKPGSLKLPRTSDHMNHPEVGHQDETLDLWGLAATSGNMSRKPNLGLLPSATKHQERPTSLAVENPHVADESLWDNLKRRTSMSMMSNIADGKSEPPNGLSKVGKENIKPELLR